MPIRTSYPWRTALSIARAAKLKLRYRRSRLMAKKGSGSAHRFAREPVFIIGCGRSGTTLLGELLAAHNEVRYVFEPYHVWTAIDPRTDMVHLFQKRHGACALSADDVTPKIQRRFDALLARGFAGADAPTLVEKTPINTLRIGYLDALAPGCRFIHIVRDGVDVARSIERLATTNTYRIAGKPHFNQWWGDRDIKWRLLAAEGARAHPDLGDMTALEDHAARGAYEWLLSLRSVDHWRSVLGDRLLEARYDDLTSSPRQTLERIASFAGWKTSTRWLDYGVDLIDPKRNAADRTPLSVPETFLDEFRSQQRRFDFHGEAQAITTEQSASALRIA